MQKLAKNAKTKQCNNCGKKYILEKGFTKVTGKETYRGTCNMCRAARDKKLLHKKRGNKFINHLFIGGDHCQRCGVEKRIKATMKRNRWIVEFKVNGVWTKDKPDCEH